MGAKRRGKWRKGITLGALAALEVILTACGGASTPSGAALIGAGQPSPPRQVTARPVGSLPPERGPTVIATPVPLPGGATGSQKVALNDRTLIISSVSTHGSALPGSVLIELRLAVRNVSGKPIRNNSAFFGLIGPGGDSLGDEVRTSAGFFGAIGAHANRSGTLEFRVPSAAESGLYLMYRPEITTETVLTRLYVG